MIKLLESKIKHQVNAKNRGNMVYLNPLKSFVNIVKPQIKQGKVKSSHTSPL